MVPGEATSVYLGTPTYPTRSWKAQLTTALSDGQPSHASTSAGISWKKRKEMHMGAAYATYVNVLLVLYVAAPA